MASYIRSRNENDIIARKSYTMSLTSKIKIFFVYSFSIAFHNLVDSIMMTLKVKQNLWNKEDIFLGVS